MKLLLKVVAVIVFGPLIAGLLVLLAVVAMVGLPLAWESIIARITSPSDLDSGQSGNG